MKPGQLCTVNKKVYRVAIAEDYVAPCAQCDLLDTPETCYFSVCDRFKIHYNCCLKLVKE